MGELKPMENSNPFEEESIIEEDETNGTNKETTIVANQNMLNSSPRQNTATLPTSLIFDGIPENEVHEEINETNKAAVDNKDDSHLPPSKPRDRKLEDKEAKKKHEKDLKEHKKKERDEKEKRKKELKQQAIETERLAKENRKKKKQELKDSIQCRNYTNANKQKELKTRWNEQEMEKALKVKVKQKQEMKMKQNKLEGDKYYNENNKDFQQDKMTENVTQNEVESAQKIKLTEPDTLKDEINSRKQKEKVEKEMRKKE